MTSFFKQIQKHIDSDNEILLKEFLENTKEIEIKVEDLFEFIDSYSSDLRKSISCCVNMCGSGGSHIPKPNISSIATIYISMISKIDFMKSGSRAKTGIFGSSDFFEEMGILRYSNKTEILEKYHWGYCDHLELSPWKSYKKLLKTNNSLKQIFESHIIYDYAPETMLLGISNPLYTRGIQQRKEYRKPANLHTFYTITQNGVIDEITAGATYWNDKHIFETESIPFPRLERKEDVFQTDIELLEGVCNDSFWRESLLKTIAISLLFLGFSSTYENAYKLAEDAYSNRMAAVFVQQIKKDLKF